MVAWINYMTEEHKQKIREAHLKSGHKPPVARGKDHYLYNNHPSNNWGSRGRIG